MMCDRSDAIRLDVPFAEQEAVRELLGVQPGVNPKLGVRELEEIARAVIAQELGVDRDSLGIALTAIEDANATYDFPDPWKPNLSAASASEQYRIYAATENAKKHFAKFYRESNSLKKNRLYDLNMKYENITYNIRAVTAEISGDDCFKNQNYRHLHTFFQDNTNFCHGANQLCETRLSFREIRQKFVRS